MGFVDMEGCEQVLRVFRSLVHRGACKRANECGLWTTFSALHTINTPILDVSLLVNASIRELRSASVVDGIRHDLLDLLRETLLQRLRNLGVAGGVGDFASLLVAVGVMQGVWNLVLDAAGNLLVVSGCCQTWSHGG